MHSLPPHGGLRHATARYSRPASELTRFSRSRPSPGVWKLSPERCCVGSGCPMSQRARSTGRRQALESSREDCNGECI